MMKLEGQVLTATEEQLSQLIQITHDLPQDNRYIIDWLMNWATGKWDTITESPSDETSGPATPVRVIRYFRAYLAGDR